MTVAETPPSFETILAGLNTTSDKIRALARAGYLRTEISKLLDIRYQHVRKVLQDAGIAEGLQQKGEATTRKQPTQTSPTHISVLLNGGFRLAGEWQHVATGEFKLTEVIPSEPGVYAFGVDGWVRYVGLTHRGLRTRMGHYQRGHAKQRTSARVKQLIANELSAGKCVQILIATPPQLDWNGFPVNTAAGLEAGLIRLIRPQWNMLGVV